MNQKIRECLDNKLVVLFAVIFLLVILAGSLFAMKMNSLKKDVANLETKSKALESEKKILEGEIKKLKLEKKEITMPSSEQCSEDSCQTMEMKSAYLYKDEKAGYEITIPSDSKLEIQTHISDQHEKESGKMTITTPIVETGYEAWEVKKEEKVQVAEGRYIRKRYYVPAHDLSEEEKKEFGSFVLVTWGEDQEDWSKTGQILFSYDSENDANLKFFEAILSTFKLKE